MQLYNLLPIPICRVSLQIQTASRSARLSNNRVLTRSVLRLDRFLTVALMSPWQSLRSASPRTRIPVLMYHGIKDDLGPHHHPYFETNTSPAIFQCHMQFMAENGYRALSLSEAIHGIGTSKDLDKCF